MAEKKSFVVYNDIKAVLDKLTNDQAGELFRAMVDYSLGEEPNLSDPMADIVFTSVKQQMNRDSTKWEQTKAKRVESGHKGGIRSGEIRRAKAEIEANEANEANASKSKQTKQMLQNRSKTKQNEANEAVNVNVNVNGNVNGNVINKDGKPSTPSPFSFSDKVISYLNESAGSRYRNTEPVQARIAELTDAGYAEADFKSVIDRKVAEWRDDPKMAAYLRPKTLFGEKFEEYAAAPEPAYVREGRQVIEEREKLEAERDAVETELESARDEVEGIRGRPGGITGNWEPLKAALDKQAGLETRLESICRRLEA